MRSSKPLSRPVHKVMYENTDSNTILDCIGQHLNTLMLKDYDDWTALSAAIVWKSDEEVTRRLLPLALPCPHCC